MGEINSVDELIWEMMKLLPSIDDEGLSSGVHFLTNADKTKIFCKNQAEIETLANFFNELYEDPACVTSYDITGWYYLNIDA